MLHATRVPFLTVWITGGVCSDIGKGCLASVVGRILARACKSHRGHAASDKTAATAGTAPSETSSKSLQTVSNLQAAASNAAAEDDVNPLTESQQVAYLKFEPCSQFSLANMSSRRFEIIQDTGQPGFYYDSDVARARFFIPNFTPRPQTSHISLGELQREVLNQLAADQGSRFDAWEPAATLTQCAWKLQRRFGIPCDSSDDAKQQISVPEAHSHKANGTVSRPALPACEEDNSFGQSAAPQHLRLMIIEVGGTAGEPEHQQCCEVLSKAFGEPALHIHLTRVLPETNKTKPAQLSLRGLVPRPHVVLVRLCQTGSNDDAAIKEICNTLYNNSCLPLGTILLPVNDDPDWPERAYFTALRSSSELLQTIQQRLNVAAACSSGRVTRQLPEATHFDTDMAGFCLDQSPEALLQAVLDESVFSGAGHPRSGKACDTADFSSSSKQQAVDDTTAHLNSCKQLDLSTYDKPVALDAEVMVSSKKVVLILHDGGGEVSYSSLAVRIRSWSTGHLIPVFVDVDPLLGSGSLQQMFDSRAVPHTQHGDSQLLRAGSSLLVLTGVHQIEDTVGVVLIGESAAPLQIAESWIHESGQLEQLRIVSVLNGKAAKDPDDRPDWVGTADTPVGLLAEFVRRCLHKASSMRGRGKQ